MPGCESVVQVGGEIVSWTVQHVFLYLGSVTAQATSYALGEPLEGEWDIQRLILVSAAGDYSASGTKLMRVAFGLRDTVPTSLAEVNESDLIFGPADPLHTNVPAHWELGYGQTLVVCGPWRIKPKGRAIFVAWGNGLTTNINCFAGLEVARLE